MLRRTFITAVAVPLSVAAAATVAACGTPEQPTAASLEVGAVTGPLSPDLSDATTPRTAPDPTMSTTMSTPKPATPEAPRPGFRTVFVDYPATCSNGELIVPLLTWTTRHATGVALSVDNPGLVGAYKFAAANASEEEMPAIGCQGVIGTVLEHRYDLHTLGAGPQAVKTFYVKISVAPDPGHDTNDTDEPE